MTATSVKSAVSTRTSMTDTGKKPPMDPRRRKRIDRTLAIASPVLFLLLWELASRLNLIDNRFFPPPTAVIAQLLIDATTGEFWRNVGLTSMRVTVGFFAGAIPGVLLGLAMGLNRWVRAALDPLIGATYPLPKTALLPLLLLIFGIGETSKITLLAIGVFYPVLINTLTGVVQIQKIYFDVGTNFGANRWRFIRTIAIPGALPTIIAGLRLGAGLALILVYVVEIVGSDGGIGFMMWNAWNIFAVNEMYVGLVAIAIIGFLISMLFDFVERRLVPWRIRR